MSTVYTVKRYHLNNFFDGAVFNNFVIMNETLHFVSITIVIYSSFSKISASICKRVIYDILLMAFSSANFLQNCKSTIASLNKRFILWVIYMT